MWPKYNGSGPFYKLCWTVTSCPTSGYPACMQHYGINTTLCDIQQFFLADSQTSVKLITLIHFQIITSSSGTVTFTYSQDMLSHVAMCHCSPMLQLSSKELQYCLFQYDLYLPDQTESPCTPEISPRLWQHDLPPCHRSGYLFSHSLHVLTTGTSSCSKVNAGNLRWLSLCCRFSTASLNASEKPNHCTFFEDVCLFSLFSHCYKPLLFQRATNKV